MASLIGIGYNHWIGYGIGYIWQPVLPATSFKYNRYNRSNR